jgi:asparagine N-glycosylation enzyme membrane subunit Stt3
LKFERRDIILIAGLILVMLGLSPFLGIVYSAIIVIGLFFGIKIFVAKKNQSIREDVGEGICMECGSKIVDKKCSNCDLS